MNTQAPVGQAVFQSLCRQHERELLRAARRLCRGNEDRAQDLVQDALLRAGRACASGRFHEGHSASAWLLRILTNVAINDFRRRRSRPDSVSLDLLTASGEAGPAETHAAPADVPGAALLSGTLDEELEQALARLSDPLRRCVALVDVDGLDYAEAAQALNVPVGTVRSRLSRARGQLGALLQTYGRERRLV